MMMMNSWSLVVLGLLHGGLGRPPIEKGTTPGGFFLPLYIRGSVPDP
jgi:hypothetical protein